MAQEREGKGTVTDINALEYMRSFIEFTNPVCRELESTNAGRDDLQPSIEPESGRFLSFLVRMTGARKVLEMGCGVANSTIWLAEAVKANGGILYTVDNHPRTWAEACRNIENSGLKDYVRMFHSDAEAAVEKFMADGEEFDLIFQDCGKYVYTLIYDQVASLCRKGGIIVADDTMFSVCDGVRKNLGLHMDRYNKQMFADKAFFSTMIPIGHGITLSLKF